MEPPRNAPPMPPQHPPHVLGKIEKRRKTTKTALIVLPIASLLVTLGIWLGVTIAKPAPTEPGESNGMQAPPETTVSPDIWMTNILRSDEIPMDKDNFAVTPAEYPVFGSRYQREQITSVTFLSTLAGMPEDAWDISEARNDSVMAWVVPDGALYRLYIAGEGGVCAGTSCRDLFCGYTNLRTIIFGENFHTNDTENMYRMFYGCSSLKSLHLSSFDTLNVQDMSGMFYECAALTSLELSSFDTTNVQNMKFMFCNCASLTSLELANFDTVDVQSMWSMFYGCSSLTSLDLSSFDTVNVQDMTSMFNKCSSLTSLILSQKFVSSNADTTDMFSNCPAGADWQHLLNN